MKSFLKTTLTVVTTAVVTAVTTIGVCSSEWGQRNILERMEAWKEQAEAKVKKKEGLCDEHNESK